MHLLSTGVISIAPEPELGQTPDALNWPQAISEKAAVVSKHKTRFCTVAYFYAAVDTVTQYWTALAALLMKWIGRPKL